MSPKRYTAGNIIPGSEVKVMCVMCEQGHGSVGFEDASICFMICMAKRSTLFAPVVPGRGFSGLLGHDNAWNLGYVSLSRNADLFMSLHIEFTATQQRCPELNFVVLEKPGDVFGLTLRGLYGLHDPRMDVGHQLEASRPK